MAERLEIVIAAKEEFKKTFGALGNVLGVAAKGLAAAAGAAAAFGAGMLALAKSVADEQDQLGKMSDKLGVTTEGLSKLKYAAGLTDVSLEGLGTGLQMMQRFAAEAAGGNEKNRETLARLGVELSKVRSQSPDEMFRTFAAAVAGVENPAERTALAMEVFGRSGAELNKMLKGGVEGLDAMAAEAERFGVVVSAQAAANAAEFNDSLTRMGQAFSGVRQEFAAKFMPALTGGFNVIAYWIADNRETIVRWGWKFVEVLGTVAEYGAYVPAALVDAWRGLKMLWEGLKIGAAELAIFMQNVWIKVIEGMRAVIATLNRALAATPLSGMFDGALDGLDRFVGRAREGTAALERFQAEAFAGMNRVADEGLAVGKVHDFVAAVKEGARQLTELGTGTPAEAKAPPALEIRETKGDEGRRQKLASDLQALSDAWAGYYLTQEQQIDRWYASEQAKFAGHAEALAQLEEVYFAKRGELRRKDFDELSRGLEALGQLHEQHVMTERDRLEAWHAEQLEKFGAFQEARAQIEDIYRARKAEIEAEEEERRLALQERQLTGYSDLMGAMGTLATAFGKKGFKIAQGFAIVQAMIDAFKAYTVNLAAYPMPLGKIMAGAALALGIAQVAKIKAMKPPEAHTGLDFVPREQTYMLSRGERVVQPQANRDLTEFLAAAQAGGMGGGQVTVDKIEVFPNVTDARALRSLDDREFEEILEERILPAMRRLGRWGIKPA